MSVHPFRRMSHDEMQGRGLCDIQDPGAPLPSRCAECRRRGTDNNPLMMSPLDPSPVSLARAYLYKAICARCRESRRR